MKVISIIDSKDLYGKERANLQVVHVLKNHGYDVIVLINKIARKSIREEVDSFKTKEVEFPRNIEGKYRTWMFIKAYFKTFVTFRKLLKEIAPDYILIPTEIALSYLYFPLIGSKAKVVFRCGDSPIVNRKSGLISKIYGVLWKNFIVKRVDKLVCNAKFIQNQIIRSGRMKNPADVVIYNYPPFRNIVSDNVEYLENNGSLRVGFMGRIVEDKGVYELCAAAIQATKRGFPITIFIGGNTNVDESYWVKIQHLLSENEPYSSRIKFLGNVNDTKKFYDNVDVACIPSIYEEPMANVVTEAKMFHKSSIIFNQGGMSEIIEHIKTGYICDNVSIDSLTNALIYYSIHMNEVTIQGEAAYKSIGELGLNKEKFEEHWLSVFC